MVTALYRRYRPETFSEMIGQSQVTDPLMTALRTGRVGHAYLFSGPRGCGKTTSARILARCLNCAEGPTDTPCGTCASCVELSRDGGGSLDVIEIDAASHGGVDDARDLRERAAFAPARDRFKIFIIDEAHMVTKEGFNALLKIVEEPPEHVKFVFATTEPDKVIGTIRSRTHHYPFRLIPPAALLDYVHELCVSEGVGVANGVLPLVVRAGGGSARDTLSILDQLIAGSEGDTVDYERAVGLLGFTHEDLLDEAVAAFGAHDAAAAFGAVDRVVQTGQDPQRFVEDLLERFRDLIVIGATNVDGAAAVFRGVPEDQLRRMFEQSQRFSHGELSRLADTIAAGLDRMRGATAPRLHLELMVARALVAADTMQGAANQGSASQAGLNHAGATQVRAAQAVAQQGSNAQTAAVQPAMGQPFAQERGAQSPPQPGSVTPATSSVSAAVVQKPPASEPVSFASAAAAARALLSETSPASPSIAGPAEPNSTDADPIGPEPTNPEPTNPEPTNPEPAEAEVSEPDAGASVVDPSTTAAEQQGDAGATTETPVAEGATSPDEPQGSIEQIRDAWAQILQVVLGSNRIAWLASRSVNPLALLTGGMLGIAFDSQTERDVFLSGDAQPALAAAIESVTGIAVRRYHPRGTRPGDLPRPETELDDAEAPQAEPPAADLSPNDAPDAPEASAAGGWPAVAGLGISNTKASSTDSESASAHAQVQSAPVGAVSVVSASAGTEPSAGEQASPLPAGSNVPDPGSDPGTDRAAASAGSAGVPASEFSGAEDLPEPPEPDEGPEPPYEQPEQLTPVAAPVATAGPAAPATPAAPTAAVSSSGPSFTRYGESVVREVLGATFLEEVPRDGGAGR